MTLTQGRSIVVLRLPGLWAVVICLFSVSAQAAVETRLTISIPTPGRIEIVAELPVPARSWSFRNAYAGALGIADRVEDFRAFGDSDRNVSVKKSAVGEYRSDLDATRISYRVRLAEPRAAHLPYVSWLAGERGLLMLADLVPIDIESLSCFFVLPPGWTIESSLTATPEGQYHVEEPQKAVFLIGSSLRGKTSSVDGMLLETAVSGTWRFKDDEAWKTGAQVMRKYLALTGFRLPQKSLIVIAPLPVAELNDRWKAETRGSTVVLLVNSALRHEMSKEQLGVIYTHELLHLWVPNSLRLEGDYDWFFEGFTMYVALRTALELKIVRFSGFLETLAGAYQYYLERPDSMSLIEASETRWTSEFSHVYIKGMLVAFVYDLMVRSESSGKATLADRYRGLFNDGVKGRGTAGADGNEAIIKLLSSSPALSDFSKSYIEERRSLKLEELVRVYGLQVQRSGPKTQLKVSDKLDREQKQLLRSLGY